jgi:hypothetical protein
VRNLQLEGHLTSFRVWLNRGAVDALATILSAGEAEP